MEFDIRPCDENLSKKIQGSLKSDKNNGVPHTTTRVQLTASRPVPPTITNASD